LLKYGGEAQIGGMLASVGQRLIEGAARQLIKQALTELEQQIMQRIPAVPAAATPDVAAPETPARKSVVLSEAEQLQPTTLVSGAIGAWLNTTTGKVVLVVIGTVIGYLFGRGR
jgi:hypothetical protein